MHEELGRDYVRSAAARGASPMRILFRHVLRNALRPVVTLLGLSLPTIFAGGIVTETVFSYPGLGWLLWQSAIGQDYPVLVGIVLAIGVLTVLGNLLADLVNGLLDPRTRYVLTQPRGSAPGPREGQSPSNPIPKVKGSGASGPSGSSCEAD